MTSTEKRLLAFAELVKEFTLAEKQIVRDALGLSMNMECEKIIQEFTEKEKTDGRKKPKTI